jgi:hypothetical protein
MHLWTLALWHSYVDLEPLWQSVSRSDVPAVELNDSMCDSEPQPRSTRIAIARTLDPKEGPENIA